MTSAGLSVEIIPGLPAINAGAELGALIARAAADAGIAIGAADVVVLAQKIVSKAEGRTADLTTIEPDPQARKLAAISGKAGALAQLVLDEAQTVMRATPFAIITRHRTGHVTANSGIDASNVAGGDETVLLWPRDPDASARALRAALPLRPAVLIADSLGRAWRQGTLGTCIGCAGLVHTDDRRGQQDLFGRTLQATIVAVADALCGMAVLAMGEGSEGTPVAVIRGAGRWITPEDGDGAAAIMRPVEGDLFP